MYEVLKIQNVRPLPPSARCPITNNVYMDGREHVRDPRKSTIVFFSKMLKPDDGMYHIICAIKAASPEKKTYYGIGVLRDSPEDRYI